MTRKKLGLLLGGGVVVLAVLAVQPSQAGLSGSVHDLQGDGGAFNNAPTQICKYCHIPHGAQSIAGAPLWNHRTSVAAFTMYGNPNGTMQATADASPTGTSLLCLSCHDGATFVDAFGETGGAMPAGTGNIDNAAFTWDFSGVNKNRNLGTNLVNDHPISITYNAALATTDGELYNPTTSTSGLGSTIDADMLDTADRVQCSSCHDVHNGTEVAAAGNYRLLRRPIGGSVLCLQCHIK